jgi:SAM-dependent methyltransferase
MKSRARSFRDPAGRLHFIGADLIRQVYAEFASPCRALVEGPFFEGLMQAGEVVRTRVLDSTPGHLVPIAKPGDLLLAHDAVPFPSFPAEWPNKMLHAAACLTLDIAQRALDHGLGLKDATPYNVLFKGARPVFVDVLSFEERDPCDPVWLSQGQFLRTFLLPLLSASALQIPLSSVFLTRRDGMEPAEMYRMLSPLQRITPPFLGGVSLPVWLSARAETQSSTMYRPRRLKSEAQAAFVLRNLLGRLRKGIDRACPAKRPVGTAWSDYCRTCSYDRHSFEGKSAFVEGFLRESKPARVLDVGCNTGHFSKLAACCGAQVVAIDQDAQVVGSLWEEASRESLDILPLVVDFARPTPALGWNNEETPSFLARARGHFDAVFMLALVHHLVVTEQIPLSEVMALAARVTRRHLVIEYVPPDDPQFRRLTRGRDALYRHLTREHFEAVAGEFFSIETSLKVENQGRWLYVMEKHNAR